MSETESAIAHLLGARARPRYIRATYSIGGHFYVRARLACGVVEFASRDARENRYHTQPIKSVSEWLHDKQPVIVQESEAKP